MVPAKGIEPPTLGTNYNSVTKAMSYRRSNPATIVGDALTETLNAITLGKAQTLALSAVAVDPTSVTRVSAAFDEIKFAAYEGHNNGVKHAKDSAPTWDYGHRALSGRKFTRYRCRKYG